MGVTLTNVTIDGSVTLESVFVPTAPTIGTAARVSGSGTEIDVPYTASANNGGRVITSYTAVSTPGSITGTLSQASSGTIRVGGLTQGTSYTFVVYATNGVGNSPNSEASNSIIPAVVPTAPTIGTVIRVSESVTELDVPYTASSSNGGLPITSYTTTSTPGSINGTLSQASSGTIRVSGLTEGTSYTFVVKATNSVGDSPNSSVSNSLAPGAIPNTPTIGTATVLSNTSVSVSYTAGGGLGTASSFTAVSTPSNITGSVSQSSSGSITVTGLTSGTSYTFVVYATNFVGSSPNSSPSNAVTPANTPSTPTVGTVSTTLNVVTIPFTAPANGGSPITSHTAVSYPDNVATTVNQASSGTITIVGNANLIRNQLYRFNVFATNSTGNSNASANSNFITYPGTPINEASYPFPGSYTWIAPAGVTSVSVVAIGGGAGTINQSPNLSGAGGGLGYKNNISVTAGNSYSAVSGSSGLNAAGGDSYFISTATVKGGGASSDVNFGTYTGDGGGNGGVGGTGIGAGGGGAGGYSGAGGAGGNTNGTVNPLSPQPGLAGSGGGGGGGGAHAWTGLPSICSTSALGGGGGGVGLVGAGTSGNGGTVPGHGGCGGSCGEKGQLHYTANHFGNGGAYGGGAGGLRSTNLSSSAQARGGNGGLRIIWGTGRSFPSTNANAQFATSGNLPDTPTIGTVTTSPSTVTVPFTAAGNGGNTITSHRAISTPGNVIATVSQASSGSIVYSSNTLLSNNTAYTFKVYAVNSLGAGPQSSASNSITYIV
jgi:hypothetical protein